MNISNRIFKIIFLISVLLSLTLIACSSNEPEEINDESVIIVDKIILNEWATDLVNIDTAYFKGDILFIKVQYGGGCKDHFFKLVIPRAIEKTYPPTVTTLLSHDNNEDGCEAWITHELKFNFLQYKTYLKDSFNYTSAVVKFHNSNKRALYF